MTLRERLASAAAVGLCALAVGRALFETFPLQRGAAVGPAPAAIAAFIIAAAAFSASARWPLRFAALIPLLLPVIGLIDQSVNPLRDWTLITAGLGGTTLVHLFSRGDRFTARALSSVYATGLTAVVAVLYLRTLAPTVGAADTFEFQVNALRLGISHGSGYPLYLIFAKLFSLLPVGGTAAFRINLSAAAFGVAAALAAYAVARTLQASRPAAWIAALSLALSIGLWSRAVEAEVYTLHVALVGVILLLAFRSQRSEVRSQKVWHLTFGIWHLLFFLFGLSLGNHLTTVLLAPAVAIAFAAQWRSARPTVRQLLIAALCFALGLSVYLYLPLRWPAVNHGEPMTWELFRHFITGQEAQGALRLNAWHADFGRYGIVARKALDQFGWAGAAAALIGLGALARRKPVAALITLAAYGAFAFFGLSFYVPDPDYSSFLLPAHFVQVVWMALGITAIVNARFTILKSQTARLYALCIVNCAFVLIPAGLLWSNLPRVDASGNWGEYRLGQYILSRPLNPGAAILADSELIAPLYYLQVAEGIRPDLEVMVLPDEDSYRAELDARVAAGQTVYLGRYLPHLSDAYYLHSLGPLTEAGPTAHTLPDGVTPVDQDFGGAIRLRGYTLDSATVAADDAAQLTLFWQALKPPPGNYRVTLRLIDADGVARLTGPANVPAGKMYPTAAWPVDDVVSDFQSLQLDRALTPGRYSLQVGLFLPFSAEGLGAWLTLTTLTVLPPTTDPPIAHAMRARFSNGLWLMGYDVPASAAPNSQAAITLFWQRPPGMVDPVEVRVCPADGVCSPVVLVLAAQPAGRIFESRHTVTLPAVAGRLPLAVNVASATAVCGWAEGAASGGVCELPAIAVEGSAIAAEAINFDNQIILESLKIETPAAAPGQMVVVTARWRGLRAMDADYTVFVHLLGPDGRVHGQVDAWPVQGTLPTSGWPPNETIDDRFEVRVPDDAPPGEYSVEVGWYLLATLDRLPVLDASGAAIDDRFLMSGLAVGR
ncbi:MAG: DUF2723 domain-containing protein [Chloroflexi bacterium]|nr:DUF2723 domain-containing protein [Chloroflexota bacterium]